MAAISTRSVAPSGLVASTQTVHFAGAFRRFSPNPRCQDRMVAGDGRNPQPGSTPHEWALFALFTAEPQTPLNTLPDRAAHSKAKQTPWLNAITTMRSVPMPLSCNLTMSLRNTPRPDDRPGSLAASGARETAGRFHPRSVARSAAALIASQQMLQAWRLARATALPCAGRRKRHRSPPASAAHRPRCARRK